MPFYDIIPLWVLLSDVLVYLFFPSKGCLVTHIVFLHPGALASGASLTLDILLLPVKGTAAGAPPYANQPI